MGFFLHDSPEYTNRRQWLVLKALSIQRDYSFYYIKGLSRLAGLESYEGVLTLCTFFLETGLHRLTPGQHLAVLF